MDACYASVRCLTLLNKGLNEQVLPWLPSEHVTLDPCRHQGTRGRIFRNTKLAFPTKSTRVQSWVCKGTKQRESAPPPSRPAPPPRLRQSLAGTKSQAFSDLPHPAPNHAPFRGFQTLPGETGLGGWGLGAGDWGWKRPSRELAQETQTPQPSQPGPNSDRASGQQPPSS